MESVARRLISGAHYELTGVISPEVPDTDLIQVAVPPLAARLGVPEPDDVTFLESSDRARILDLHMSALTAILSAHDGNDQVQVLSETPWLDSLNMRNDFGWPLHVELD